MNNRRNELLLASSREYCKCVVNGKTLKYNQVAQNGNFASTSYWGGKKGTVSASGNVLTYTCTEVGTYAYDNVTYQKFSSYNNNKLIENHKYILLGQVKPNTNATLKVYLILIGNGSTIATNVNESIQANKWSLAYSIIIAGDTNNAEGQFGIDMRNAQVGDTYQVRNAMCIDLTALGLDNISNINDFFATDLGKYIAKDNYLPYEPNGKFIHAQTPIKFKGRNLLSLNRTQGTLSGNSNTTPRTFSENEYYLGISMDNYYGASTITNFSKTYDSVTIENANVGYGVGFPVRVIGNKQYHIYFKSNNIVEYRIGFYDKNGNFIDYIGYQDTFTTPQNAYWCNVVIAPSYLNTETTFSDIIFCEQSEYKNKYEPNCDTKTKSTPLEYNQLIINGNFESTDNWSLSGCSLSVFGNVGTLTITSHSATNGIETGIQMGGSSHKYALVFNARTSVYATSIYFRLGGSSISGTGNTDVTRTDKQFKFIFNNSSNSEETLKMFINSNDLYMKNGDKLYLHDFMVVDLTNLYGAGNEPTSVDELNVTELGQAINNGEYLPYSVSNSTYNIGHWDMFKGCTYQSWNGKLTKNYYLINLDNLSWTSEDIGMIATLPNDFKTFEENELASVIAEKYLTKKYYDEIADSICIADIYGYGYSIIIRYSSTQPSGFALFELATPTTENVTTRMVSRRTINVESENEIDMDFTKE